MSTYVVSWCEEGLEGIIPYSELEKTQVWDILNGNVANSAAQQAVNMMVMRAKFNTQRHYEVYSIETADNIKDTDLKTLFKESPQYAADLIRERGYQIYSNRRQKNAKVVIK